MRHTSLTLLATVVAVVLVAGSCSGAGSDVVSTAATSAGDRAMPGIPAGFDIEGHRGARGLKPENTLPSFETALDLGVTTLELDLHYSADDEVVIWHDPVVDAAKCGLAAGAPASIPDPDAGDATDASLAIRSLTVSDLAWFRCDRNPSPDEFPDQDPAPTLLAGDDGYGIVTLTDLFDFVDRYAASESKTETQRAGARVVQFNIETKRDRGDPATIGDGFDGETVGPFEERILAIVDERGLRDRVIIQSFDTRSLQAIDAADPGIRLAVLTALGHAALPAFVDGRSVIWSPRASTVDAASVEAVHAAGHTVIPWTVNDPDEVTRLVEMGVDGLITDRPDLFADR